MKNRRGFTLVEAGVSAAAVMVSLALGAVGLSQPEDKPRPAEEPAAKQQEVKKGSGDGGLLGSLRAARASARQIKDSTQIRGLHQGLVMFSTNNNDRYPLPSLLDKDNSTLTMPAAEKDTTGHVFSILIFQGFFGPDLCVSPSETNKKIKMYKDYEYSDPTGAAKPKEALWDPKFSADFTSKSGGYFSYAHSMPSPTRYATWSNSFDGTQPAVANRAPRIEALVMDGHASVPLLPEKSNTIGIHLSDKWAGNVAFNDNAVEFKTEMTGLLKYESRGKEKLADNFFFNEQDDPADSNAVLGIYVNSGSGTKFFRGIWD